MFSPGHHSTFGYPVFRDVIFPVHVVRYHSVLIFSACAGTQPFNIWSIFHAQTEDPWSQHGVVSRNLHPKQRQSAVRRPATGNGQAAHRVDPQRHQGIVSCCAFSDYHCHTGPISETWWWWFFSTLACEGSMGKFDTSYSACRPPLFFILFFENGDYFTDISCTLSARVSP